MLDELTKKARESMDPPWDELREARNLKSTLEEWKREGTVPEPVRQRGGSRWLAWAGAAAAVLALGVGGYWSMRAIGDGDVAPMTRVVAERGPVDEVPPSEDPSPDPEASPTLTLADGSTARLSMEASVVIASETPGLVRLRQSAGEVRYEVSPDPARRFVVEAAGVEVEVIGTVFIVLITDDAVEVAVERGRVRVDDQHRDFELAAGERVSVNSRGALATPNDVDVEVDPDPGVDAKTPSAPSAEVLMKRHDAARAAGKPAAAAEALRQLIAAHPGDARVPVATMSLGRIESQRGRHVAAARAFETYWKRFRSSPLAEDALAEAARAWQAAGKAPRARDAARRYLDAFPSGLHVEQMRRMID